MIVDKGRTGGILNADGQEKQIFKATVINAKRDPNAQPSQGAVMLRKCFKCL